MSILERTASPRVVPESHFAIRSRGFDLDVSRSAFGELGVFPGDPMPNPSAARAAFARDGYLYLKGRLTG